MDADKAAADALIDVTFYATEERGKALRAVAAKLREVRRDALEEAARCVTDRGRKIGGAIDPLHTATAIRALIEKEKPSEPRD